MKKHSKPAVCRASGSLYFFAMLLGSISPRKNTQIVVTIVPIATRERPHVRVTIIVVREPTEIWAMLVPMRIVEMARSKLSSM